MEMEGSNMPDIEEMVMAIASLEELEAKLQAYLKGTLVRGAVLSSDEVIEDVSVSLNTALQIIRKRLQYHRSPQIDVERMTKALS